MLAADVQHDVPVAVEPAGAVAVDITLAPGLAVPRLPHKRRMGRIDADALDRAAQAQADRASGNAVGEPDDERVTRLGHGGEGGELGTAPEPFGRVDPLVRAGCLGCHRGHRAGHQIEVVDRGEHDRLLGLGADGRGLRVRRNTLRLLGRRREPEGERGPGGGRGKQPHVDQLEELHVEAVGNPVEPVDELIGHPCEGLDEGDPGIGDVVVGPLRTALLHHALGLVDEVLEASIVEVRNRQGHESPSLGMV